MGQRRVLLAIAALLAAISLVAAGCGGSQPEQTGTDNEEIAPARGAGRHRQGDGDDVHVVASP